VLGFAKAVHKYTKTVAQWEIAYYLGKGKTEGNITHLEWTAVASNGDITSSPELAISGDAVLINIGDGAVVICKHPHVDKVNSHLAQALSITFAEEQFTP